MPNTFITPQIVANEAILMLRDACVYPNLVHRGYDKEFRNVGDTINIRKPAIDAAGFFNGTASNSTVTEQSVSLKLNRFIYVNKPVTSKEMSLDIANFAEQIIKPAVIGISEKANQIIANTLVEGAGQKVTYSASPTTLEKIADIAKDLDKKKAPKNDRSLVFSVGHKYAYNKVTNMSNVAYAGDNLALREANLGRLYMMDTYMDQDNPDTLATTAGSAVSYKVAGNAGATAVALSSVDAATGTVKTGDGFIFKGVLYRFTADATAVGGAVASVAIAPALQDKITTSDSVVLVNKEHSVAFQKNAVAFACAPLAPTESGLKSYTAVDEETGIAIRVTFDYDSTTKSDVVNFDLLCGAVVLNSDLIVDLA